MPRFTLLILAAICLGLACGLVYVSVPRPEPEWITVSPAAYDLGEQPQKTKLECRFTLTNRHSKPLRIRYALRDCTCTEVTLPPGVIKPGHAVEVVVAWDTDTRRGPVEVRPLIVFSEGDESVRVRELNLHARARVVPDYEIQPRELVDTSLDSEGEIVTLMPLRSRDCRIERAFATDPAYSVEELSNYEVRIRRSAQPPFDRDAHLVIITNSSTEPEFHIPIRPRSRRSRPASDVSGS